MACELAESAAEAVWPSLLELRRFLSSEEACQTDQVGFVMSGGKWSFLTSPNALGEADREGSLQLIIALDEDVASSHNCSVYSHRCFVDGRAPIDVVERELTDGARAVFRLYLPMLIGGFHALVRGELFVTAHVAQTLDGRIACHNGQSQWISNQANLVHSHRLRALHDGVLVGRRTVENDDPALTVRHVAGVSPRRIVLNASAKLITSEANRYQVFQDDGCLVLSEHDALANATPPASLASSVELVGANLDEEGTIAPDALAAALTQRGLNSIFIEGGSQTISKFFTRDCIDILHVHIAPVILGSGISGFALPVIEHVQHARRMQMEHFILDGELLMECREQPAALAALQSSEASTE
ncbi:MAG: riboflavin-specific deaminase-like protein [Planctomycetota bacterium]|jgi:riboflavin-specific deaminase-like protein